MATASALERMAMMPDNSRIGSVAPSLDPISHTSRELKREQRAAGRRLFRASSHRSCPATSTSIPVRYQTFFTPSTEQRGFSCQAARFGSSGAGGVALNDSPGPGTYSSEQTALELNKPSFSKRGTGGFASKAGRFYNSAKQTLSPCSYNPTLPSPRSDFNRANVSSNFQSPIVREGTRFTHTSPGPSSYTIRDTVKSETTQASFKSTTQRSTGLSHTTHTPGPAQYTVKDHFLTRTVCPQRAVFNSTTKRESLACSEGPGPADYTITTHSPPATKQYRHKHYLCISAPAIPLPPPRPLPGPGHYDTHYPSHTHPVRVSGAVFRSTTTRWEGPIKDGTHPGPGSYNVKSSVKQSFLCNTNKKWV